MLTASVLPSTQFISGIRSTASPTPCTPGSTSCGTNAAQAGRVLSGTHRPSICPFSSNSRVSMVSPSAPAVRRSSRAYCRPSQLWRSIVPTASSRPCASRASGT